MTKLDNTQKQQMSSGAVGIGTVMLVAVGITSAVQLGISIYNGVMKFKQAKAMKNAPEKEPTIYFNHAKLQPSRVVKH